MESGLAKITAESLDGREAIIGEVRPGETFGELALIDAAPRSAIATAVVDTVTALAHELRRATSYLGELHFLDLCGRVGRRR